MLAGEAQPLSNLLISSMQLLGRPRRTGCKVPGRGDEFGAAATARALVLFGETRIADSVDA